MKRRNLFFIGGLVLVSLLLFIVLLLQDDQTAKVSVYVHDNLFACVSINTDQTLVIDQGNGCINIVSIEDGLVRMEHSTCKNQICVHTPALDVHHRGLSLNTAIICLPNGVSVILGDAEVGA